MKLYGIRRAQILGCRALQSYITTLYRRGLKKVCWHLSPSSETTSASMAVSRLILPLLLLVACASASRTLQQYAVSARLLNICHGFGSLQGPSKAGNGPVHLSMTEAMLGATTRIVPLAGCRARGV